MVNLALRTARVRPECMALLVLGAVALVGCSSGADSDADPLPIATASSASSAAGTTSASAGASTSSSASGTSASSGRHGSASASDAAASLATADCAGSPSLPDGVGHVCGGSADITLPEDSAGAAVQSPSKNILCTFGEDTVDCIMDSPETRIDVDTTGRAYAPTREDGPGGTEPTTLDYGSSASYGDFACRSDEAGMTCWSTVSRHGMFLSRDRTAQW